MKDLGLILTGRVVDMPWTSLNPQTLPILTAGIGLILNREGG